MLQGQMPVGNALSNAEITPNVSADPAALEKIVSPYKGRIMPLSEVPDNVFSQKMVGDGFAVELSDGTITAPTDAQVLSVFPTKHAIALVDASGNEILLHLGLDTVNLESEGFEVFVEAGDRVQRGQKLAHVDLAVLQRHNLSAVSPLIFTNLDAGTYHVTDVRTGEVERGTDSLMKITARP